MMGSCPAKQKGPEPLGEESGPLVLDDAADEGFGSFVVEDFVFGDDAFGVGDGDVADGGDAEYGVVKGDGEGDGNASLHLFDCRHRQKESVGDSGQFKESVFLVKVFCLSILRVYDNSA
jgi:hypothetical protein